MEPSTNTLERKRFREELSPGNNVMQESQAANVINKYPSHWVIHSIDSTKLSALNPFVIEKVFQSTIGSVEECRKLRSGDLLVKVRSRKQAEKLQAMTTFHNINVEASAHRTLNSSRGVVRSYELSQMTPEELLDELKPHGVTAVKHIMANREGNKVKTRAIILTFDTPTIPSELKAAYLRLKVTPFIPAPLRCFKCQKYGHSQTSCKHETVCPKCSQSGHNSDDCQEQAKCVNCGGDHPAYSTSCPVFVKEKAIAKIRAERGVSFPEARRLHETGASTTNAGESYANIAKKSPVVMVSRETQTACSMASKSCQCTCTMEASKDDKVIVPRKLASKVSTAIQAGTSKDASTSSTKTAARRNNRSGYQSTKAQGDNKTLKDKSEIDKSKLRESNSQSASESMNVESYSSSEDDGVKSCSHGSRKGGSPGKNVKKKSTNRDSSAPGSQPRQPIKYP